MTGAGKPTQSELLLSEEELGDIDEDEFDHAAYVDTLERVLGEKGPPWHIGLFGTWGSGKSSIINLLYKRIEKGDPTLTEDNAPNYDFTDTVAVRVNAWEHTGESVKTALLLDLNRELDRKIGEDTVPTEDDEWGLLDSEEILRTLYDVEEREEEPDEISTFEVAKGFLKRSVKILAFLGILLAGIIIVGLFVDFISTGELLLALVGSGILVGLLQLMRREYREERKKNVQRRMVNPRNEWTGAYRDLYEQILSEAEAKFAESPAESKSLNHVVITVDDLDRCESESVYETLISMKSFMHHDLCTYIIPCDEDALYRHVKAADTGTYLDQRENQQNFLAKFFQTELRIPELEMEQLEEFIEKKERELQLKLPGDIIDHVLSQSRINTPRRVIQVLNRITTMRILAEQREGFEAIDTTNDEHLLFLAKIAILQEDYPELYNALEQDKIALQTIYHEWESASGTHRDAGIIELFEEVGVPQNLHTDLLQFLIATKDIDQDPEPYYRLSGSQLSLRERFANALIQQRQFDCERMITTADKKQAKEYVEVIKMKLGDENEQYKVFQLSLEILEAFEADASRQDIADELYELLEEEDHRTLLREVDLTHLRPCIERLDEDQRIQLLRWYVDAAVSRDSVHDENLRSLLNMQPGELEQLYEVRDDFAENLLEALDAGTISKPRYDEVVDEVSRRCPPLYSRQLVEGGMV